MKTIILAAAAATAIFAASPALATGPGNGNTPNCPGNSCNPNPDTGDQLTNALNAALNNQQAQGQAQGQTQGQGQNQGQIATGGNSSSGALANAAGGKGGKGGAGGNASGGAGGSSSAMGGAQQQAASSSVGPISIDNSNRQRTGAQTAIAASIDGSSGMCDSGGGFSAAIQAPFYGVSMSRRKADRFCQMVAVAGNRGGISYLAHADQTARDALAAIGLVDDQYKNR